MIPETAPSVGAVTPQVQEHVPAAAKVERSGAAPVSSGTDEIFSTVVNEEVAAENQEATQVEDVTAPAPAAAKPTEAVEQEIDSIVQNFAQDGVEEDPELLQAIQDVVQSRLDDIDGQEAAPVTE
jgi:hypothetical protein